MLQMIFVCALFLPQDSILSRDSSNLTCYCFEDSRFWIILDYRSRQLSWRIMLTGMKDSSIQYCLDDSLTAVYIPFTNQFTGNILTNQEKCAKLMQIRNVIRQSMNWRGDYNILLSRWVYVEDHYDNISNHKIVDWHACVSVEY